MNRTEVLLQTPELSVTRFDHPPQHEHCDPDCETSERWTVSFVQTGSFDVMVAGKRRTLSKGSVFVQRPGLEFRCAHSELFPSDVCASVSFDDSTISTVAAMWNRTGWWARECASPRLAYVDRRMADAVSHNDAFELERWGLATLTALYDDASDTLTRGHYAVYRGDVDAVMETCRAIERDPTERCTVAERASTVGFTGPQLTHAFRRYVGESPHQYVVRQRLIVSCNLLMSGFSVSETCYRSGFENLSHFCRTFQRTFGVRASMWQTIPLPETRRKVQALRLRPT
ncbi:MAG: AraC family transcriptional regulator [Gemmatimonadaceae bacterium]